MDGYKSFIFLFIGEKKYKKNLQLIHRIWPNNIFTSLKSV